MICAYAVGSSTGLLYLRAEYWYLRDYLEAQLQELRDAGLLGRDIGGRRGFDFDIRIQMGAGAYVCGESRPSSSRARAAAAHPVKPPFPAAGLPRTADVHRQRRVVRLCQPDRRTRPGLVTPASGRPTRPEPGWCPWQATAAGLVSGDRLGTTIREVSTGRRGRRAGGPGQRSSGECASTWRRRPTAASPYEDPSCNGALTVFGPQRDPLDIAAHHLDFFIGESCGIVPCRVGNVALRDKLLAGHRRPRRPARSRRPRLVGAMVRSMSRCGLGGTLAQADPDDAGEVPRGVCRSPRPPRARCSPRSTSPLRARPAGLRRPRPIRHLAGRQPTGPSHPGPAPRDLPERSVTPCPST